MEFFDELSEAEAQILDEMFAKYGHLNRWVLVALTHAPTVCPEWSDPHGSNKPIDVRKIFASRYPQEYVEHAVENLREADSARALARALV